MRLFFHPLDSQKDLPEQRALFRECFPENASLAPETEAFYRWKFQSFPAAPHSYEYIARDDDGNLVGYYAALPFEYSIGSTPLRCGMVCDVMTSPRMRGKGIFTKLGAYSLEELKAAGVDFVTGYPIRPEVIPGHLKVGWEIAFKLPMYLFPMCADTLLAQRRAGFLSPLANVLLLVVRWVLSVADVLFRDDKVEVTTLSLDEVLKGDEYGLFFRRWSSEQKNILKKDSSFLKWRYSAPDSRYFVSLLRVGGELEGISFARPCLLQGVPSLAVLDLMLTPRGLAAISSLGAEWRRLAGMEKSEVIALMMSEHQARRHKLFSLGFIKTPAVFSLIVNILSDRVSKAELLDARRWHLMWVDSDDL